VNPATGLAVGSAFGRWSTWACWGILAGALTGTLAWSNCRVCCRRFGRWGTRALRGSLTGTLAWTLAWTLTWRNGWAGRRWCTRAPIYPCATAIALALDLVVMAVCVFGLCVCTSSPITESTGSRVPIRPISTTLTFALDLIGVAVSIFFLLVTPSPIKVATK
jgi:hypothetical protein